MELRDIYSAAFPICNTVKTDITLNEDAVLMNTYKEEFFYMGLFDGCGEIGNKKYKRAGDHTGSWIASRLAAKTCDEVIQTDGKVDEGRLEAELYEAMKKAEERFSEGGVKAKDQVSLPASMALCKIYSGKNGLCETEIFWNGNARGYLLDSKGLSLLTKDDMAEEKDPLKIDYDTKTIENCVNADKKFTVNNKKIDVKEPSLIILSSVGGYGCFQTPMDFEGMILRALLESGERPSNFESNVTSYLLSNSKDDFSICVTAVGFDDFEGMKKYFVERYKDLASEYLIPEMEANKDILNDLFEKYCESYYRFK